MFKGLIKKAIKKDGIKVLKELIEVLTTAQYSYNRKTKEFKVKLTKEW
jgi:hypothetical protein